MSAEGILFRTARLHARRLGPGDVDALFAVYGDAETMRPLGDGVVLPRDECERWVEVTAANVERVGYGMSALVLEETGAVVGFMGLVHPGGQAEPELKYALHRGAWGRGLATEAARAMLAWGAERFGMQRIIATTAEGNTASHRVLEKCGMGREEPLVDDDGSVVLLFAWTPGAGARGDASS
ncbi:MAG: GNAT family N-acetyltransferase [Planctomycetota bacterium]|nr:GNAT family N-acetyltransferase [Planctomycetota bacterium]